MKQYLYAARDTTGLCKIGATKDMSRRWRNLSPPGNRRGNPLVLLGCWEMPEDARTIEAYVKDHFKSLRVPGGYEWFRVSADKFMEFVVELAEAFGGVSPSTIQNFLKDERRKKPHAKYLYRKRQG